MDKKIEYKKIECSLSLEEWTNIMQCLGEIPIKIGLSTFNNVKQQVEENVKKQNKEKAASIIKSQSKGKKKVTD